MTLRVDFRRAAQAEFVAAAEWYEAHRAGLGLRFVTEIERCVALAAEHPLMFAIQRRNIRRVTADHFPYSVYYVAEPDRIVVLAVFHSSRDPLIWRRRP